MKTTFMVLAIAGLSGCAVYTEPAYDVYAPAPAYVVPQPVYQPFYFGGVLQYGGYPRGFSRPPVHVAPPHAPRPRLHAPGPGQGARQSGRVGDRDGDGRRGGNDRRSDDRQRR